MSETKTKTTPVPDVSRAVLELHGRRLIKVVLWTVAATVLLTAGAMGFGPLSPVALVVGVLAAAGAVVRIFRLYRDHRVSEPLLTRGEAHEVAEMLDELAGHFPATDRARRAQDLAYHLYERITHGGP